MKKSVKKLKRPEMFLPSTISDYSVIGMYLQGVLAFILEPQKEWLPYLSLEMHFSDKQPSELSLFILDRSPFEPTKQNLFCTKDRLKMVAKKVPGIASLCDSALPFINLKIDYEDRAILKLTRDADGEMKVASNGFEENESLHPSSIEYAKVAECVACYLESSAGKNLKARELGSYIRQTASLVTFHCSVKNLGLHEERIEMRVPRETFTV